MVHDIVAYGSNASDGRCYGSPDDFIAYAGDKFVNGRACKCIELNSSDQVH